MAEGFIAGVEPGGLYSAQEIRVLICYMLAGTAQPMTREQVIQVLAGEGMVNFYEAVAALDALVSAGLLLEEKDGLILTGEGREAAGALTSMVPYTLRERSLGAALRLLARQKYEQQSAVTIDKGARGCAVTCTALESGETLFSLTIRVADELQADLVKECFLNDPTRFYRLNLALLTGGISEDDKRIVIEK
ncbi:MAG: DUF4364 family protein [Oscillospiraceae bacterium]|nr:DUF4364 family protein [Oscillospiraceae bacterium]